jgi:hypothetical protein
MKLRIHGNSLRLRLNRSSDQGTAECEAWQTVSNFASELHLEPRQRGSSQLLFFTIKRCNWASNCLGDVL